jgi:predicted Ser/Thr protein kinase
MKKDTESLNAQLLQERTNVRQLTAANDQLTAANTQLTAANQKLSGKVSIMTEEKQSLQNLNSQLTQESKYMKQLTEANEQLAAAKNQLSERVRNMNEEKQSLQSLNSQLNQESAQLSENLRKVNEDKVFLLQMTKTLRKEREDKQTQLHCKQRDTETINGETEETRKAMEHMKTEKEELQLKMGESEQRLKEVEQQLKTSETAREIAERKLADSNQILNIPFKDVQLNNKELGSGSYGGVYLGYWRGSPVAVKILHEDLAKEQYQRRLFEQEAAIYSRLHHPNITAICGVIQERDAPFSLVMELLQASMAEVIEAALFSGRYLTLREKTDVSHDCLSGLMYIHELPHPVLHGDIRPTNILMTSMMRAKLGDLGSARFAESSLSAGPMSPLYVAPERFADRTLPNSKAADVYSMGVCLSELFTGSQLDQADRPRQLSSVKQRDLRLVCIMMANRDVQQRMTASAALPVNDRVSKTDEYKRCDPRRMVRGIADGVGNVTLCDKAW